MTTTQSISLTRLVQSKANVRRTGQTSGIEALMASIAAHGLRQNLNVLPTTGGRFEVIAGGRRLIALKKLARAGIIPADMPVPCLVLDAADNATEISLAENQVRQEMHPDDQCAAFRSLIDDGMPVEDVAARFGVTPAVVRQRLKLAAVSPKLRALYRAGQATLAQMMALTLSDDHTAQERAFGEGSSPHGIRQLLTQDTLRVDARLVRFVGLDAYRKAGGGVLADLFDPAESYITDTGLLNALASAKLAEIARVVEAEGWSWVSVELVRDHETVYQRVYGEVGDAGNVVFSPGQMAHAGARIGVGYDGAPSIERGQVRPQDARRLAKAEGGEDGATPARSDYPASLVTDLTGHRTAALRLKLAQTPLVALAATVHALITTTRYAYTPRSALQINVKYRDLATVVADTGECAAHAEMKAKLTHCNDLAPADPAALWDWLRAQDTDTLLDVLATFAAVTLDAVNGRAHGFSIRHANQLAIALDLDMTQYWQPSPRFMGRMSKAAMAAAVTEAGHPEVAADLAVMKKANAAIKAAQALAGTGWLPPMLRRPEAAAVNGNVPVAPWEGDDAEHDEEAA